MGVSKEKMRLAEEAANVEVPVGLHWVFLLALDKDEGQM